MARIYRADIAIYVDRDQIGTGDLYISARNMKEAKAFAVQHTMDSSIWDDRIDGKRLIVSLEAIASEDVPLKDTLLQAPPLPKRYVVSTGWSHIFTEYDDERDRTVERERDTRWVYDLKHERLHHLDVAYRGNMTAATSGEIADVEDSVKNANPEFLEPATSDLIFTDRVPPWARKNVTAVKAL